MNHLINYSQGVAVPACGASLGSMDCVTEMLKAIDCDECKSLITDDMLIEEREKHGMASPVSISMSTKGSYEELGSQVGNLVDEKQKAYGDSFNRSGDILRSLYPDGIKTEDYDDMLAIVRIVDKLFRVATHGSKDPMKESPGRDIAGYGLLMARRHEECIGGKP